MFSWRPLLGLRFPLWIGEYGWTVVIDYRFVENLKQKLRIFVVVVSSLKSGQDFTAINLRVSFFFIVTALKNRYKSTKPEWSQNCSKTSKNLVSASRILKRDGKFFSSLIRTIHVRRKLEMLPVPILKSRHRFYLNCKKKKF